VLQGLTKRDITWLARVSMPMFWLMCGFVLLVYFVPGIVTWLPSQMQ
jgi:TRAP-type C4-dicarboxylate transport system permease large subunit